MIIFGAYEFASMILAQAASWMFVRGLPWVFFKACLVDYHLKLFASVFFKKEVGAAKAVT
jgi:hypothetical protein